MKYTDQQRLKKIYDNANKLNSYIISNKISKEQLLQEETLQWLVTTPLYNIGEHSYCLSDEYKEAHPEILWSLMAGLRHRLVHDYDGTNWNIIASVVFEDLPELIIKLKELINKKQNHLVKVITGIRRCGKSYLLNKIFL